MVLGAEPPWPGNQLPWRGSDPAALFVCRRRNNAGLRHCGGAAVLVCRFRDQLGAAAKKKPRSAVRSCGCGTEFGYGLRVTPRSMPCLWIANRKQRRRTKKRRAPLRIVPDAAGLLSWGTWLSA